MKMTVRVLITLLFSYFILSMALIFMEIQIIKDKAMDASNVVKNASYNALRQAQLMDDFMSYRGEDYYKLRMPNLTGEFVEVDTVEAIFNVTVSSEDDMNLVYDALYDNDEYRSVVELSESMRTPIMYYSNPVMGGLTAFPTLQWYNAPLSIMLGLDNQTNPVPEIKTIGGTVVSPVLINEIVETYRFKDVYKKIVVEEGATEGDSVYKKFFNTPLNTGITYLNRDLLTALYINNIDLLMRAPYTGAIDMTVNCGNDTVQPLTLVCGNSYVDRIEGEEGVQEVNPVNNGKYAFLRGVEINSTSVGKAYQGTKKVDIQYKVIDLHNTANDSILRNIFGADTGTGAVGGSKAEYFKTLNSGKNTYFGANLGSIYDTYPFIVAKVTFYADFIVPYTTPLARFLASEYGETVLGTFLNVADSTNVDYGAKRISYTTYFAVAP